MNLAKVGLAAVALAALGVSAQAATPIHQYTFNGNGNDTGSAPAGAAVMNGNAAISDGQLQLTGGYASLPIGSSVSGLTNGTLEAWVTWTGTDEWQTAINLGTGATTDYIAIGPKGNGKPYIDYYNSNNGNTLYGANAWPTSGEHQIVAVMDQSNDLATLYIDGVSAGSQSLSGWTWATIGSGSASWLGQDEWNDPTFKGSINEFRVYNVALSANDVAASFAAGPTAVPEPASLGLLGLGALGLLARRRH